MNGNTSSDLNRSCITPRRISYVRLFTGSFVAFVCALLEFCRSDGLYARTIGLDLQAQTAAFAFWIAEWFAFSTAQCCFKCLSQCFSQCPERSRRAASLIFAHANPTSHICRNAYGDAHNRSNRRVYGHTLADTLADTSAHFCRDPQSRSQCCPQCCINRNAHTLADTLVHTLAHGHVGRQSSRGGSFAQWPSALSR